MRQVPHLSVLCPNFSYYYSSDSDWFLYHSSVVKVRFPSGPANADKNPDAIPSLFRHRLSPRRLSGYGAPIFICHRSAGQTGKISFVLGVFYYTRFAQFVKGFRA